MLPSNQKQTDTKGQEIFRKRFSKWVTQFTDDQIHVLYAEEFERPDYNEILSKIWTLMTEFELSKKNGKIYVDGVTHHLSSHSKYN